MLCTLTCVVVALCLFLFLMYKFYDYIVRVPYISGIPKKYVLITGCSSGFGFDAVKRLDRLGCQVFAGVRDDKAEQKIRDVCSTRVIPVRIDIAKHESVQACYEQIVQLLPEDTGLWGLVNNAGISSMVKGPTDWHTTDVYRQSIDVNVLGTIDTTLTFLPLLKIGGGRIVNVTSALGTIYAPLYSAYTVTKRAVNAFSDTLRLEMCYFGIHTSIVEPGSFFTMINDDARAKEKAQRNRDGLSADVKQQYGEQYLDEISTPRPHQNKLGSHDLTPVIDTYEHALFAMYPRARYVVGKGMKQVMLLHWLLPDWVYDHFAKNNAPIPAVASRHV